MRSISSKWEEINTSSLTKSKFDPVLVLPHAYQAAFDMTFIFHKSEAGI